MRLISIAAAAALSLAAGASFAQTPPGPRAPDAAMRMDRPDPARMAERHAQRLRDVLQLTPAQQPLVAATQPPAGAMDHMRDEHEAMKDMPLPQRLDRMQAKMAEHEARF